MTLKEIKDLISFLDKTRFTEMEIEQEGIRLRLTQDQPPVVEPAPLVAQPAAVVAEAPKGGYDVRIPEEETGKVIASPIVGTFYAAPAPDKPPYVQVGDTVKKGQVVCIVEAMKLMNEIESEFDGKVAAILVEEGKPVEFGQPLLRIEA